MPRFAANLDHLFTELPFMARFAAAAAAGFQAVEMLRPYEHPASELAERLAAAGLSAVLINMPAGDWAAGERGIACLPDRRDEFRAGVEQTIRYARTLACERVHLAAGVLPDGADEAAAAACYLENLAYATDALAAHDITALIEPINRRDVPGFFLKDTAHALAVIAAAGRANLRLQYDVYHAQITEGDLARTIAAAIDRIGHFQIANPPDRHEPDTGEINYPYLFELIDRLGYRGWVGCEYRPRDGTAAGLGWAKPYGLRATAAS